MRFMRELSDRHVTAVVFVGLLAAGVTAMVQAYLILGRVILSVGLGEDSPLVLISAGALVGTITAYIIHEVGNVLPGVMRTLRIERVE